MSPRAALRVGVVALALAAVTPLPATAQPAPGTAATPADRKAAAEKFAEGEKAFAAGDFGRAAAAFEAAHRLSPHPSALWNAARAWQRAGELATAANLYARYLREAPAEAPDRVASTVSLAELSTKLGRLEISGRDLTDITVDERPTLAASVYVTPGSHVVRARSGGRELTRTITAQAGLGTAVALVDDAPPAAPPPASPVPAATVPVEVAASAPTPPAADAPAQKRRGWSPVVVVIGAGATAFCGIWTAWSGWDTVKAKEAFDAAPREEKEQLLKDGKFKQARTNVFLGTTIAAGAFTGIAALFLTNWGGSRTAEGGARARTALDVGPASVQLSGSF